MTGSDDGKVKVVDPETGKVIYDTAFHNDWVCTVWDLSHSVMPSHTHVTPEMLPAFLVC